jgi:hypothetical protein
LSPSGIRRLTKSPTMGASTVISAPIIFSYSYFNVN